jgi:hypothetical protein
MATLHHPLATVDEPVIAARRAAFAPHEGEIAGPEAGAPFDAIMASFQRFLLHDLVLSKWKYFGSSGAPPRLSGTCNRAQIGSCPRLSSRRREACPA